MDYILIGGLLDVLTPAGFWNLMKVVLGLGFVIFVHELGHFLAAKACGVKCEKFYVGFDVPMKFLPSSLAKFQWGETEYGIGIVPLGGYVKMLGQDDNPGGAQEEADRAKIAKKGADGEIVYEHHPRSYQAKTVPQRMLIISAGVIMNLIFAVIMAMIAYKMGVSFGPCEIESTLPGDPAWVENIEPGSKLLALNKGDEPNEFLRFTWDLRQQVGKHGLVGEDTPMQMLVRNPDGSERDVNIMPSDRLKEHTGAVTLGVLQVTKTKLSIKKPVVDYSPAARATPEFKAGDIIVAVNGETLPVDEEAGAPLTYHLQAKLAQLRNEEVEFTVRRKSDDEESDATTEITIKVEPTKAFRFGLVMEMGPIVAVQKMSPAAEAGLEAGDVIVELNGEPAGDPLTFPDRIAAIEADTVELTIRRGKGDSAETKKVNVRKNKKRTYVPVMLNGYTTIDTIGAAVHVPSTVAAVIPDSPAAKVGMKAGDKLSSFRFVPVNETAEESLREQYGKKGYAELLKAHEFDDFFTWNYVFTKAQAHRSDVEVEFKFQRDGESKSATLAATPSDTHHLVKRGFIMTIVERVHVAETWGEAFKLGVRETKEKIGEVVNILGMLFTGKIGIGNLSGPVGIFAIANSEASYGIARLLIFLTLLSANLAILNSLPIPVLDGGHFLFLVVEGVWRRPVSEKWQFTLQMVGLFFLLGLILFVTTNDIWRLVGILGN